MHKKPFKILAILLCLFLLLQQTGFAQVASVELNISGHFAALANTLSPDKFRPLHLRSISYDGLNNNFKLLLDKGDAKNLKNQDIESTTKDLLNYFFVGIALPNDTFWVNLRPDSPKDIIDPLLAQTEVGKILLEADLQLKKDTANATNPGTPEGREYWNKLYQKAGEIYGNQNVTIPTLTRPWIVPGEIIISESTDSAYVYKATLKVMLEQDYLKGNTTYAFKDEREKQLNEYSSQIIRKDIIPKLTKEINNAKRYAPLRQVYYSLILAQWFKARNLNKNTQYAGRIDKKDLTNLQAKIPYSVNTYFNAYKENFAKGEYNVKEPVSTPYGQVIRSYFSGGIVITPEIPDLGKPTLVNSAGTRFSVIPGTQAEVRGKYGVSVEVNGGMGYKPGEESGSKVEAGVGNIGASTRSVESIGMQRLRKMLDMLRRSPNVSALSSDASDAEVMEYVIKELESLSGSLRVGGLILRNTDNQGNVVVTIDAEQIEIVLSSLNERPQEARVLRRLLNAFRLIVQTRDGVEAINFRDSVGTWFIVGFKEQLDIRWNIDHEQREIILRKRGLTPFNAHALVIRNRDRDENQIQEVLTRQAGGIAASGDLISPSLEESLQQHIEQLKDRVKLSQAAPAVINKAFYDLEIFLYETLKDANPGDRDDIYSRIKILRSELAQVLLPFGFLVALTGQDMERKLEEPETFRIFNVYPIERTDKVGTSQGIVNVFYVRNSITPDSQISVAGSISLVGDYVMIFTEISRADVDANMRILNEDYSFFSDSPFRSNRIIFDRMMYLCLAAYKLSGSNLITLLSAKESYLLAHEVEHIVRSRTARLGPGDIYIPDLEDVLAILRAIKDGHTIGFATVIAGSINGVSVYLRVLMNMAGVARGATINDVVDWLDRVMHSESPEQVIREAASRAYDEADRFWQQKYAYKFSDRASRYSEDVSGLLGTLPKSDNPVKGKQAVAGNTVTARENIMTMRFDRFWHISPWRAKINASNYYSSFEMELKERLKSVAATYNIDYEKLSGILIACDEVALNIMLHGGGGTIQVSLVRADSSRSWIEIIGENNNNKGIKDPRIELENSKVAHANDKAESGGGFLNIVFYPDKVTIETDRKRWEKSGTDKASVSLVNTSTSEVQGTRMTLAWQVGVPADPELYAPWQVPLPPFSVNPGGGIYGSPSPILKSPENWTPGGIDPSLRSGLIPETKETGGIDFRFLPIVTASMDNLKIGIKNIPVSSLQGMDLTQEWSDIERLVNSGITPSAERLKEYLAVSCFKDNLGNDMDKIVSCISDILRMEEQSCSLTDPTLKDILVVLGSGRSGEELKVAFSGVI